MLAVVLAGLAAAFAWFGHRTVSRLGREVPIYPNANYEWCMGDTCQFRTKDKLRDVIAYFEHTPTPEFPHCEQVEAHQLVLRGQNKQLKVWIREEGGETLIDYDIGALPR